MRPSNSAQVIMLLAFIREVRDSSLGRDTDCPNYGGIVPYIRPQPIPSESVPIHCSLPSLSLNHSTLYNLRY
jgi:hypothetical protein